MRIVGIVFLSLVLGAGAALAQAGAPRRGSPAAKGSGARQPKSPAATPAA